MNRLQLLVEVLQRVYRMLSEDNQRRYQKDFDPYRRGSSGQYVYRLKGEEVTEHLQPIGALMAQLIEKLRAGYGREPTYRMLERISRSISPTTMGMSPSQAGERTERRWPASAGRLGSPLPAQAQRRPSWLCS